jgi:uncharacterized protein (TIGR02452 family)
MNRSERVAVAADTVRIGVTGVYADARAERFDIRERVRQSVENTAIIDLKMPDTVTVTKADAELFADVAGAPAVISISDETTLDAAYSVLLQTGLVPTILNFASAKHPGGGFQNGALAQEEDIAYRSCLYTVLSAKPEYYRESLRDLRGGLYFDKMIYTEGLVVIRDADYRLSAPWTCNCITVPAPNRGAALANGIAEEEIDQVMAQRIDAILKLAIRKGAAALILGAFGCGVFKNDPRKVAQHFRTSLIETGYQTQFQHIRFAIPGETSANHTAFRQVFFG